MLLSDRCYSRIVLQKLYSISRCCASQPLHHLTCIAVECVSPNLVHALEAGVFVLKPKRK